MTGKQDKKRQQNLPDNQARRKTIKKLVIGASALAGYSMLPEKWTKPIIEQIVLPAHAQTSGLTIINPLSLALLSGTQNSTTVSIRVYGAVYPPTANLALLLAAQGGLNGGSVRHPSQIPGKNMLQEAVATMQDFLVSEAVAAETCPQLSQQVSSAEDGSFSADFEISCGPGITSVSATATLSASPSIAAEGVLLITADSDAGSTTTESPTSTTTTTEPSTSAYSFINNSSSTVTVEWETPNKTDTVGPGESIVAPDGTDELTNIWVTGAGYMFTCPNVPICFSGTYGGDMGRVIAECGAMVAIGDCSSAPAPAPASAAFSSSRNYAW